MAVPEKELDPKETYSDEELHSVGLSAYEQQMYRDRETLPHKAPLIGATAYEQAMLRQRNTTNKKTSTTNTEAKQKDIR